MKTKLRAAALTASISAQQLPLDAATLFLFLFVGV